MSAVDVCDLPTTGGSTFVVVAGLFVLVAGVIMARWVRSSAGRLSVVVAPLVLLGGLVLAPQVADPCAPATTTVAPATTTTVAATTPTTTVVASTTTVPSATTTTTVALTCAMGGSCAVGDAGPGGGFVFYDAGSTQSWGRYLEVACAGWQNNCDGSSDPKAAWGCEGTLISGAGGIAIGTGEENTNHIVTGCPTAGIAADLADDYSRNTLDDWFLPSQDEFNALCKWAYGDTVNAVCNNHGTGGLTLSYGGFSTVGSPTVYYWGSFEYNDNLAWFQDFNFAYQYDFKSSMLSVRPVRAF